MAKAIKSGLIGSILGFCFAFAAMFITTGSYKQRVDDVVIETKLHGTRLDLQDTRLTGLEHDLRNNKDLLLDLKAGQKDILKKISWE